ncbi:hypothetical protein A225_3668 [Klebsiella michiganensis E718]|nr:hypothetical protein A225_3668 [Klebsiella michiganensis E718]
MFHWYFAWHFFIYLIARFLYCVDTLRDIIIQVKIWKITHSTTR